MGIQDIVNSSMTKAEKSEIFRLLNTAEGWVSGYRSRISEPEFTDSADVPVISGNLSSVDSISASINACSACKLCETRKKSVPGEGPADIAKIKVLVIGYAPDDDDDSSGKPFSGNKGQLLDKMLSSIGLSRAENCYATNLIKCKPFSGAKNVQDEIAVCLSYLTAQITVIKPKFILALGQDAARGLLGIPEEMARIHGRFFDYMGIPLFATYHPVDLIRDETLKRPAWEDLKSFKELISNVPMD
jgi:DNA polymerase